MIINTATAARILKVSPRRVRALIKSGRLPAYKFGRDWIIDESDLDWVAIRRPGRPRKEGR